MNVATGEADSRRLRVCFTRGKGELLFHRPDGAVEPCIIQRSFTWEAPPLPLRGKTLTGAYHGFRDAKRRRRSTRGYSPPPRRGGAKAAS